MTKGPENDYLTDIFDARFIKQRSKYNARKRKISTIRTTKKIKRPRGKPLGR